MDERSARASDEICPSIELNGESSNLSAEDSVRKYFPLPDQIQPTHDHKSAATGDKSWQEFVDVTSPAGNRLDGFVDNNAHTGDGACTPSAIAQGCLQHNEDAKDNRDVSVCTEAMEVVPLDPDQQLHNTDSNMIDSVQVDQIDVDLKDISMPDGGAALAHVGGLQETGASHSVQESVFRMMDEGRDEETSLEMLSGAVESFENMQRQSEEALENVSNLKIEFEDASAKMEKDHINRSSTTKSPSESEDNESSVIDGSSAPGVEFQDKEHFLNMLCELAAVSQQERELSRSSKQVASGTESLAAKAAHCDEPRRLSFVDLLRKQMGHVHDFTNLTEDSIYQEFLKQNQDLLGCKVDRELHLSLPSASISPHEGVVARLDSEQTSNGSSYREGDTPSTDGITHDSKFQEIKLLEKGGGDFKEEIRDDERSFVVGDLVWAKVKSHPWWPGQIFDAADASVAAKRIQKPGRTLVAFFGDGTFGWLQQSQLIPFMPNFAEKVKQTTMKSFCRAVAGALEEISRRMELGLRCSHSGDAVYSPNVFPDLNVGIRNGVRLRCHGDIDRSKELLQPDRVLKFIQAAACSPLYSLSLGLEYSKLCGHVYGFRSFMLSPKRPESKPTLSNMTKTQKKEKVVQRLELKRRCGQDEPAESPKLAVGAELKRVHINEDARAEEFSAAGRAQSPRFRSMGTPTSREAEESKAPESELKSHEKVQGSTWVAKGKRLHVSPDCKDRKRVRGWQSLEPLRDSTKSGLKMTLGSSDDDDRTLFDITGFHSLKKKKKGVLKSTTDVPSKEVGQHQRKVNQEVSKKEQSANVDESREDKAGLLDGGISSVDTMVSQPDPCSPPVIEDSRNAEGNKGIRDQIHSLNVDTLDSQHAEKDVKEAHDCRKAEMENVDTLDSQHAEKDVKEAHDCRKAESENEDTSDQVKLKGGYVEVREQIKGQTVTFKINCAEDGEKHKTNSEGDDAEENEKAEIQLKTEVGDESKKDKTLGVRFSEKGKGEDLKTGNVEKSQKGEGANNSLKKQMKRTHSDTGDTLGLLMNTKKWRKDTQGKVKLLSSVPENKDSAKMSKLGLSMRKVAGALKGRPSSVKSTKHILSKDGFAAASVERDEETKKPRSDYPSSKRLASAARSGVNDETSLAKLLNILQEVAINPLRSANMRSSLKGVMPVFLKFRDMVFLKSAGYAAAAAAGKLIPSIANGHISGGKKVDDKGGSDRKTLTVGSQGTSGSKESSVEQKVPSKTESCSESIGGPGSQRLAEPDSLDEAKSRNDTEEHLLGATLGQISDVQSSHADNGTTNVETSVHGKMMAVENQGPCVQDFAVGAHKANSEALPESENKVLGKSEEPKELPEKLLVEKRPIKEKLVDPRHIAKRARHHISRAEDLSVSKKSRPSQSSGIAKVSLGLFMQFPEDYPLPSEIELRELFNQFGTLETFGIRIYRNDSTAQVVFKHRNDAEAAWKYARKNGMFGQANVSYKLRHFSPSSKSDSKLLNQASAKKGSMKARDANSMPLENIGKPSLAEHSIVGSEKGLLTNLRSPAGDSSLNRPLLEKGALRLPELPPSDKTASSSYEPVSTHSPATDSLVTKDGPGSLSLAEPAPVQLDLPSSAEPVLGPSPPRILQPSVPMPSHVSSLSSGPELGGLVGPSIMHQQAAVQTPSIKSASVTNFFSPPSVSNANVGSGDFQDQLLKLLQEVNVLVSSTALSRKST